MESLIRSGINAFDIPSIAGFVLFLILFLFRVAVNHMEERKKYKTKGLSDLIGHLENRKSPRYYFITEQLLQDRFKFLISYPAIKFFLRTNEPSINIQNYITGFRYIEFDAEFKRLRFRKCWGPIRLTLNSIGLFVAYAVAGSLGLAGIIAIAHVPFTETTQLPALLLFILAMFVVAWLSLDEAGSIAAAKRLVARLDSSSARDRKGEGYDET